MCGHPFIRVPFPGRVGVETPTDSAEPRGRGENGGMKTRTLMLLALVTGLAILAAGAIQILMAGQ